MYEWQDQELGINEVENLALISSTYFTFLYWKMCQDFIGILDGSFQEKSSINLGPTKKYSKSQ